MITGQEWHRGVGRMSGSHVKSSAHIELKVTELQQQISNQAIWLFFANS